MPVKTLTIMARQAAREVKLFIVMIISEDPSHFIGQVPAQNQLQVRKYINILANNLYQQLKIYQQFILTMKRSDTHFYTIIYRSSLHPQWRISYFRSENVARNKTSNMKIYYF